MKPSQPGALAVQADMSSRCISYRACSTSPRCTASEPRKVHLWTNAAGAKGTKQCRNRQFSHPGAHSTWPSVARAASTGEQADQHPIQPADEAFARREELESSDAVAHTKFIAETLLPTGSGKFRLRGYRHTVHLVRPIPSSSILATLHASISASQTARIPRAAARVFYCLCTDTGLLQSDGSVTMTEPSAILTGEPEGKEDVSPRGTAKTLSAQGFRQTRSEPYCLLQVVVRVHDACFTSGKSSSID